MAQLFMPVAREERTLLDADLAGCSSLLLLLALRCKPEDLVAAPTLGLGAAAARARRAAVGPGTGTATGRRRLRRFFGLGRRSLRLFRLLLLELDCGKVGGEGRGGTCVWGGRAGQWRESTPGAMGVEGAYSSGDLLSSKCESKVKPSRVLPTMVLF